MKFRRKIIKTLLIIISAVIITVILVIVFISPIAKYLVEKYDEKYLGRQITLDRAYVNPFTGYIHFKNLKIFELKSDSIFFSADGVSVNFAILKLLSKNIEISELILDRPRGIVIQEKKILNFNDIIRKFTPEKPSTTPSKFHFNLMSVKINNGEFHYLEKLFPINYFITNADFESTGKQWDSDTLAVKFSFLSGAGSGSMKGDFVINLKTLDYRINIIIQKFDLGILKQYVKDLVNYGTYAANLDANIKANGNFSDAGNINIVGMLAINDFHFGKNPNDDLASFNKLALVIIELNPNKHKYLFDSVSLDQPFFKYERYDKSDNLQMMFGNNGTNATAAKSNPAKFNLVVVIANYIKDLSKNFFKSSYKINQLAIYKGEFKFNDYSLNEKFSLAFNPIDVFSDSINKKYKRVKLSFKTGIKPYGQVSVDLSINPNDSGDFDMKYLLQKIPVSMFNPYIIAYTSFPLDRGTLEFTGIWNVRNGFIQSNNHLLIIDPRVTERLKNKGQAWLPLRSMMSLIRENGNAIDFEIPITGNLKKPKLPLNNLIVDLLENMGEKLFTADYRIELKSLETEIEKSLTLTWEMRQSSIGSQQQRFIEKMADFLVNNPEASILISPQQYAIKEKEYILFYEVKKQYYLLKHHKNEQSFSKHDAVRVEKMSIKDPLFAQYVKKRTNGAVRNTIQEKLSMIIGPTVVNAKYYKLIKEREDVFLSYFKKKGVEKRIKISPDKIVIPYNGFSYYKIEYKVEYPDELIKAHQQMNELNNESPRKQFKKDHNMNKDLRLKASILTK